MLTQTEPLFVFDTMYGRVFFYDRYFIDVGERIGYQDIEGISYLWTRTTHLVYVLPASSVSECVIGIKAKGKIHKIQLNASGLFVFKSKGEREAGELFSAFCAFMDDRIKPLVVAKLLLKFATQKKFVVEDESGHLLTVTPKGLHGERSVLLGLASQPDFLPWSQYHSAVLQGGALHIYGTDQKDQRRPYREYCTCSMSAMNAVVMPDLLNYLSQRHGVIDEKARTELVRQKDEAASKFDAETLVAKSGSEVQRGRKCPQCGCGLPENANFCTSCGVKIADSATKGYSSEGSRVCPRCRSLVPARNKYCQNCGTNPDRR